MSRAFVKEDDDGPEEIPERRISEHPNYVTPGGLEQLRAQVAELEQRRLNMAERDDAAAENELRHVERDLRYFVARAERAIVVDPAAQPRDRVAFGATVTVREPDGAVERYTVVGEDEADLERLTVSWVSPLGKVLTGARVGDTVEWRRPAGALRLTVEKIEY